ncbi:MAG: MBL fold metallo-hydrolase [Clostridia bacterium]|nr:MBL fold metallo-hydrolase [Clostridia bacterium]
MKINVNYHSSIQINDVISIDPLKIEKSFKAKYVFFTHSHWDHYSIEDTKKIVTTQTILICPKTMEDEVKKTFKNKIIAVEPNKTYQDKDLKFETFASYNIGKPFHPKDNNWVGYILKIENQRVAVVGDSDNTPDLQNIKTDILLIPIGGTYTMSAQEAAEATNIIKPKKVIPTHYGEVVGNKEMANEFKNLLSPTIECEILDF